MLLKINPFPLIKLKCILEKVNIIKLKCLDIKE